MLLALKKNWFLVSLFALLGLGYAFAAPLAGLAELSWLKWAIVSVTMFMMAWPLKFAQLTTTPTRPQAALLATVLNVGLIPLLVWPFAGLAGVEVGCGMIVAAATPCTLATGAVWTRRAGGNDGIAMIVTILTNSTCFMVLPFWIYWLIGAEIEPTKLIGTIYKLLAFVVLPIGAAQLLRIHQASASWATVNKPKLSIVAMVGILSVVFLGAIGMGNRVGLIGGSTSVKDLLVAAVVLVSVHCCVFWLGMKITKAIKLPRADQIAVGFAGSQKTLVIGLSTSISLGFSMLPILMYHVMQLVIGTVLVERMRLEFEAEVVDEATNPEARCHVKDS